MGFRGHLNRYYFQLNFNRMMKMDQVWQGAMDRRSDSDRRRRGLPSLKSLMMYRRRRYLRRESDRRGLALLDYYHPPLLISIILVLVLSVIDAMLTLMLMDHGAVELNPVMAFFIELGSVPFFVFKYCLTAFSVCIVVVFNYYFFRHLKIYTGYLLQFFSLCFAAVIIWELFLTFRYVL